MALWGRVTKREVEGIGEGEAGGGEEEGLFAEGEAVEGEDRGKERGAGGAAEGIGDEGGEFEGGGEIEVNEAVGAEGEG